MTGQLLPTIAQKSCPAPRSLPCFSRYTVLLPLLTARFRRDAVSTRQQLRSSAPITRASPEGPRPSPCCSRCSVPVFLPDSTLFTSLGSYRTTNSSHTPSPRNLAQGPDHYTAVQDTLSCCLFMTARFRCDAGLVSTRQQSRSSAPITRASPAGPQPSPCCSRYSVPVLLPDSTVSTSCSS